jgi:hypothetical protein
VQLLFIAEVALDLVERVDGHQDVAWLLQVPCLLVVGALLAVFNRAQRTRDLVLQELEAVLAGITVLELERGYLIVDQCLGVFH